MDDNNLMTLLLGGGGLGAAWALIRWYLKERMQQELDTRTQRHELQKRGDELRMRKLEHEQEAMNQVFARFSELSARMADLIFELALEKPSVPETRGAGAGTPEEEDHVAD